MALFSKRHYLYTASMLRQIPPQHRNLFAEFLIAIFAKDNSLFDPIRFRIESVTEPVPVPESSDNPSKR